METGLNGKVVVCTGAAGGIGRATAELFAREGARLLCVERTQELALTATEDLPGGGHFSFSCDLHDPECGREIVHAAVESQGRVDVLAHLGATLVPVPIDSVTPDDWDLHMDVNARSSFFLAREAAVEMKAAGHGGRIVLVASGAWLTGGMPDRLPYAASKGAVTTMARSLAKAFGPDGITVNVVAPGMVDTKMMALGLDATTRAELEAATPLRRFARPEEIAACVVFLAADAASFVSGATLNVSGGFTLY